MYGLVDTHCHIHAAMQSRRDFTAKKWHDAGETGPDSLIKSAVQAGVNKLICVGTDFDDSKDAAEFAKSRENCWSAIGVHPHEAKVFLNEHKDLIEFEKLIKTQKVVAIGEVGLDYYYEHSPRVEQLKLLEMFLDMAASRELPLIFHVREAFDDFWPVFDNFKNLRGVLHSFTDSLENMNKGLDRGLLIGLNGIMTFTRESEQLDMAKQVPLDSLLLETDSPYLAPKPYRGKVCKPEYIKEIAEFLCELKGVDFETLALSTSQNANQLFKLD